MRRAIIEKTGLTCALMYILKECIEDIHIHANAYDLDNLDIAIDDTKETLEKMIDVVTELEYILYLKKK